MSSFTNYLETRLLDHVFGGPAFTPPGALWVELSSTEPTETGVGVTPPSGGGYSRAKIETSDWLAAIVNAEENIGEKRNGEVILFSIATGDWGVMTHFALFDAATAGNMLAYGALVPGVEILEGHQRAFAAGDLLITMD